MSELVTRKLIFGLKMFQIFEFLKKIESTEIFLFIIKNDWFRSASSECKAILSFNKRRVVDFETKLQYGVKQKI